MQKKHFLSVIILSLLMFANTSCSKDDDDNPAPKTKTELITAGTWKFSDAKVNGASVASFLQTCQKDNILSFLAAGTGTAAEGATKCNASDPDSNPFDWSFQTNETVLFVSTPFFTGGSTTFTIVSLTETQLVLSQTITLSGIPQNAEITFIH
ncbi:MAG TPA: lipocalin family protein [Chitinophagaceae bacterium]|nr:lipocalin family protein [Chitinophagaceae bacterium]